MPATKSKRIRQERKSRLTGAFYKGVDWALLKLKRQQLVDAYRQPNSEVQRLSDPDFVKELRQNHR